MENLPIFEMPAYQNELVESYQDEVHTMGETTHGPIEFNITGNNDLIDLNSIALHLKAKITKADGTTYAADGKIEVAFINNVLHSLFSDIIVSLNDTILEGGQVQYGLKSMISTIFSYSSETMQNQVFASGFSKRS